MIIKFLTLFDENSEKYVKSILKYPNPHTGQKLQLAFTTNPLSAIRVIEEDSINKLNFNKMLYLKHELDPSEHSYKFEFKTFRVLEENRKSKTLRATCK